MRFLQWLQRHVQEVLPAVPSGALCKSGKPDINGVYCMRCWVVLACLRSDGVCAVPERHLLWRDGLVCSYLSSQHVLYIDRSQQLH